MPVLSVLRTGSVRYCHDYAMLILATIAVISFLWFVFFAGGLGVFLFVCLFWRGLDKSIKIL